MYVYIYMCSNIWSREQNKKPTEQHNNNKSSPILYLKINNNTNTV